MNKLKLSLLLAVLPLCSMAQTPPIKSLLVAWDPVVATGLSGYVILSMPVSAGTNWALATRQQVGLVTTATIPVPLLTDTVLIVRSMIGALESPNSNIVTNKAGIAAPGKPLNFRITGGTITGVIELPDSVPVTLETP